MRMRKKKNGAARLAACDEILYKPSGAPLSDPREPFGMPQAQVYLEIGAGKGGFACKMAAKHPGACYYAMEKMSDCVVLGAELAMSGEFGELKNLRFIVDTADNLLKIFKPGSIDTIFLNFSDPWTKKGYAKRRLTHKRYLALYMNLLRDGGKIRFKTDNNDLFDFSLSEIEEMGLNCNYVTRDLHSSAYNEGNVMTEYETNFSNLGMKINMLELSKPAGYAPQIDPAFTEENPYRKKNG